jgi:hypothetical protein
VETGGAEIDQPHIYWLVQSDRKREKMMILMVMVTIVTKKTGRDERKHRARAEDIPVERGIL